MPSNSLSALFAAIAEVQDLEMANPSPTGKAPREPAITRVIGRAGVVLLSSHFERYFYAVNAEVAMFLNAYEMYGHLLPERLRLTHSKVAVEELADTSWEHRSRGLCNFVINDSWLWRQDTPGTLNHERLLMWMTTPNPENIIRYFKLWGIPDIFTDVTRTATTRHRLVLRIHELVDKRNNIAHGDLAVTATQQEVRRYSDTVRTFCERADRKLASTIGRLVGARPW